MNYNELSIQQIKDLVVIFRRLLDEENHELNENTKSGLRKELRDANLELILERE